MKRLGLIILLLLPLMWVACGGGGGGGSEDSTPLTWTWMSGSNTVNQSGVYNFLFGAPGARHDSTTWTDSAGYMWLFGGTGFPATPTYGHMNDLWRFNGTDWTWMSGSYTDDSPGVYGVMGSPDAANVPGARTGAVSWTDNSGNLWLFGGEGYAESSVGTGRLNDLWLFDGKYWTWMKGSNTLSSAGVYGTMGSPDATNVPGARDRSLTWTDNAGNMWLFGGLGFDRLGVSGYLNDLWKFDGTDWTWMMGSNTVSSLGVYGTMGSPAASNMPGARDGSASWTDGAGNLWLFGGNGYAETGAAGWLNDLWRFDGANWTWVSGSKTTLSYGTYGTMGLPDASNIPGARFGSVSWTDSADNLWLFGGHGYPASGSAWRLNDLWKFDGTYWTWISGSDTINSQGVYGTMGSSGVLNVPGARDRSVSWTDSSGKLWLFGGLGIDETGNYGHLNDMWRFKP